MKYSLLAAWLIISASTPDGKLQTITAVQYSSMEECGSALAKMKMTFRPKEGKLLYPIHCSPNRPAWWSDGA